MESSEEDDRLGEQLPEAKMTAPDPDIKALCGEFDHLVEQLGKGKMAAGTNARSEEHSQLVEQPPKEKTTAEPDIKPLSEGRDQFVEQASEEKTTIVNPVFEALSEEIRQLRLQMSGEHTHRGSGFRCRTLSLTLF